MENCANNSNFEKLELTDIPEEVFNELVVMNQSFPNLLLTCDRTERNLIGERIQTDCSFGALIGKYSQLRKVHLIRIIVTTETNKYVLIINNGRERNENQFDSADQLQEKLSEQLEGIDYIRYLHVELKNSSCNWNLYSTNRKQITVEKLVVHNIEQLDGSMVSDILEQVEPGHLKCFTLIGKTINSNAIFDMSQVVNAEALDIPYVDIRIDQLLKLNAENIALGGNNKLGSTKFCISAAGMNEFIKKCLLDLNKKYYNFEIFVDSVLDSSEILDGLEISSNQKIDKNSEKVLVNSTWPNFQLKLRLDCEDGQTNIEGCRLEN